MAGKRKRQGQYGSAKKAKTQGSFKFRQARSSTSGSTGGASRANQSYVDPRLETKYVDGYLDDTAIVEIDANDTTWANCEMNPRQQTAVYGCLPVPRQGNNYSDRDGRKIYQKNIKIRGHIDWALANTLTAGADEQYVRLIVVKDTRTNGTTLSAEDVIGPGLGSDGNASLTADCAIMSLSNPDGWGRYEIVHDELFEMPDSLRIFNDGTDGAAQGIKVPFKINVKCNCEVNFDATTGVIGSIVDNSYHLLAAGSGGLDALISYQARTAFVG